MKSFKTAAAAMMLATASALGFNGPALEVDDSPNKPNPKPRRRDKNGNTARREFDAAKYKVHIVGEPSRQVLRCEERRAKKAAWNGSLRATRPSRGGSSLSDKRTKLRFSDEMKGFSGAKLMRKTFNGEIGLARIR